MKDFPGRMQNLKDLKVINWETGSRIIEPAKTIEKVKKKFQKIGVEGIEQIKPTYTDNIPIFRINKAKTGWKCHRALHLWTNPPSPLDNPPREVYGKGITVEQSRASALMEAVERYCGQIFPQDNIISGSYEEVQDNAISPSDFKFPGSIPPKCRSCAARGVKCFPHLDEVSQEWRWGYSLTRDQPVLVPAALVYYPYMSRKGKSFIFNDTSGLASGNTLEEAVLSGLAEVIERDALYNNFNLNERDMSVVEFESLASKNRYVREFVDKAISPDRVFTFLIKNDPPLRIPTITALICYRRGKKGVVFGGTGTHLNPEVSLIRALTEMEQQKVRKGKLMKFDESDLLLSDQTPVESSIRIEQIPNRSFRSTKIDLEFYREELSRHNREVIVVDLTRGDIEIPVVRVMVPELIEYEMSIKNEVLVALLGAERQLKTVE